jgi:hypothetical protein
MRVCMGESPVVWIIRQVALKYAENKLYVGVFLVLGPCVKSSKEARVWIDGARDTQRGEGRAAGGARVQFASPNARSRREYGSHAQ